MNVAGQASRRTRGRRRTRAEKAEDNYLALLEAAIYIVNRSGYSEATISRITKRANLAHGTFYGYFESRDEILNLLPVTYGTRLLEYIKDTVPVEVSGIEREMARFNSFLEFFTGNRWSTRIISEAATLAPIGFERYSRMIREGYVRALRRSSDRGEIRGFENHEFEHIADMLISIRADIAQRYLSGRFRTRRVPDEVYEAYRKVVLRALFTS